MDSGSYKNIIGKHTTNRLKLQLEPHPKPYKIRWIKSAGEIRVSQRCKVTLFIEKYRDEIYCYAIIMDACSLIFGMPIYYDADAIYFGRDNWYKINKNGVNYTLIHLKEDPKPKPKAFKIE